MNTAPIILAALAIIAVASGQDVTTNFDQTADFTKFKTYKWVTIPGGMQVDDLLARQLTGAVDAELATKGLTKTDSDSADLYMGYQVATSEERQLNAYASGGLRWGGGFGTATTSTLTIGSFSLDMYDRATKQIVWRGIASKTLDPKASAEKRQKNIQSGAAKLLKNFPPKRK
jgi:Domain of unknown function (DUF4136)